MNPSERYQGLTQLRERARKLELARAMGATQERREALAVEEERLAQAHAAAPGVDHSVSPALLILRSASLQVHEAAIALRATEVAEREVAERAARAQLGAAATDRLVAARWVERERRGRVYQAEQKADREASDRASSLVGGDE